jgi:hypothetical protein
MGQIQADFINAAGGPRLTFWFGIHTLVSLLRFLYPDLIPYLHSQVFTEQSLSHLPHIQIKLKKVICSGKSWRERHLMH